MNYHHHKLLSDLLYERYDELTQEQKSRIISITDKWMKREKITGADHAYYLRILRWAKQRKEAND